MRNARGFAFVVLALAALQLSAADPAAELARGRAALNKKDYAHAAEILSGAIPAAEKLASPEERAQALTALNFYAAIAYHAVPDEARAKEHLQAFFKEQPNARIDPKIYGQSFATFFNQVRTTPTTAESVSFESLYPNYDTITAKPPAPFVGWVATPEYQYLATADEKRTYENAHDDAARAAFIDEFWNRRDPTPGDGKNEFREQVQARIAFADYYFGSADVRGSLTDRGKIFLLLGKPGAIENRRFRPSDGELSLQGEYEYGEATLEVWKYPRQMLPVAIPTAGVSYLFVTHKRLGDHMLHDLGGMALRALLGAAEHPLKAARK
jgi:GWxTD domain-containing protein